MFCLQNRARFGIGQLLLTRLLANQNKNKKAGKFKIRNYLHFYSFTLFFGYFSTFLVIDVSALGRSNSLAIGRMFDFASHFGCHLLFFLILAISVGHLISILTLDFGHFEVHLSGHQFTFSPCHWFTSFVTSPNL